MQHLQVLYFFVTALIGIVSLGIATADYFKIREKLLRYYIYFHAALTLLVISGLLFSYVSLNISGQHPFLLGALEYLNVFVAQYALMVTFPLFIHTFFNVPHAKNRNLVFISLAVLLCLVDHVFEFLLQIDSSQIMPDDIENMVFMLVFFYGLVTGISEYKHCEPEKAPLAKRYLVLLGIFMPAIIIDSLLHDTFPITLYPILYCSFSINFTYHLVRYAFARSQTRKPSQTTETGSEGQVVAETEGLAEENKESLLTKELYQQYNISPREQDVLPLVLQGSSNNQIAETLFISLSTVKAHLRNIYAKFGVKNRYELVAFLKHGDENLIPRSDTSDDD